MPSGVQGGFPLRAALRVAHETLGQLMRAGTQLASSWWAAGGQLAGSLRAAGEQLVSSWRAAGAALTWTTPAAAEQKHMHTRHHKYPHAAVNPALNNPARTSVPCWGLRARWIDPHSNHIFPKYTVPTCICGHLNLATLCAPAAAGAAAQPGRGALLRELLLTAGQQDGVPGAVHQPRFWALRQEAAVTGGAPVSVALVWSDAGCMHRYTYVCFHAYVTSGVTSDGRPSRVRSHAAGQPASGVTCPKGCVVIAASGLLVDGGLASRDQHTMSLPC
jgi:hypothetical protein